MDGHIFGAQDLVGDNLVPHEVQAATAKHGATGGVVVHSDGDRQIGCDDGSGRMVRGARAQGAPRVGGACEGQGDVERDAGGMADQILRGRDSHDRVGFRRHDVETGGGVEAVVREVLEGQVKRRAQGVVAFQRKNVRVVDVADLVIRRDGG